MAGSAMPSLTGLLPHHHVLKGHYHIIMVLGTGGMGAVYEAKDSALGNRLVAIKEMLPQNPNDPQAIPATPKDFKREADMLASLHHPNLPSVHEHFDEAGRWYLVTDFIEGETLEKYVKAIGKLSEEEVVTIGIQLCTVLHYLHTQKPQPIVFRDLKPANIMRTADGHLYLIDFGIARHFTGNPNTEALGTLGYAAPEQCGKQPHATPQSDIYGLGVILHQLLSGNDPADNPFHFAPLHLPSQFTALGTLIMQMVEMDADKRPDSMATVKQKLQGLASPAQQQQVLVSPQRQQALAPNQPALVVAPRRRVPPRKVIWIATMVLLAFLLIFVLVMLFNFTIFIYP